MKPRRFGGGIDWLSPIWLVMIILIGLVASLIGFALDGNGFWGNLLAEIAGIFFSIVISLWIVDTYLKHQKSQQWAKVRGVTYEWIAWHLCSMVGDIAYELLEDDPISLYDRIANGRLHPDPDTVTAMKELSLRLLETKPRDGMLNVRAAKLYETHSWALSQILDVYLPRVLQESTDQEIVDALIGFDDAARVLQDFVRRFEQDKNPSQIYSALIRFVNEAGSVYGVLCATRESKDDRWYRRRPTGYDPYIKI